MEFENLIQLIKTVSSSELTEFSMKDGDFKVSMNKKKEVQIVSDGNMAAEIPVFTAQTVASEKESAEYEPEGNQVKAPLVGTFYSASAPDAAPFVKVGDTVKQGDVIAYVGTTGNSTGYHLHFEVRINGTAQDPLGYVSKPK